MSDLLIRGMEMPKNCCGCVFSWYTPTGKTPFCKRTGKDLTADVYFNKRSSDCPLVPVPPHGRLIDADALWVEINKICDRRDEGIISDLTCLQQILSAVRHAPTIIPAEEGE